MKQLNKTGLKLNQLLERNYDAEKGYLEASKRAKDPHLVTFFKTYAEQRYRFGHDIKGELINTNQFIDKGGSLEGAIHRLWLDVKAILSSSTDEKLIEECIRGEEIALENYSDVLSHTEEMMPTTESILKDQIKGIEEAIQSLKELEVAYS